ncbi:putative NAD/FAD-binding protein [Candidatus Pelagibacter ubique]|uniref:NAD/FAD-binding protein n=1 Tax=Pelagibacter ubique TaxID=198252 RepID=A0ABX1SYN9_PELUQ|nr:FAD-dependent oxidoreductase [Candidatus Pelagibacter ubique]NMN66953.1 putative NAD/FAD-binding protein [Candidatus Pelagibacter ubique]
MKIAVVGAGISGLSAAYYLSKKHKVDLFEKENQFGGHANTLKVAYDHNKEVAVDIGFMVFNKNTYPNLINFFSENKIEIEKSDMSFSVSVKDNDMEYCGKGLGGIFSNKKNLMNLKFIKMFFEIISFYKNCEKIETKEVKSITLGKYLEEIKISDYFINYHIVPMVSAIWSMPPYEATQMPLSFFLNFFKNHGLFKIKDRPQWFTVANRSKTYVDKVISQISGEYFKNYNINKVVRSDFGAKIFYGEENEFFDYDKIVIATHADEALKIIDNPTSDEELILKNFKYRGNIAVIHFDESIMPKNKKAWCSWNSSMSVDNIERTSVTYWLNQLQNLKIDKNIFLTINPFREISADKIYKKVSFTHPYFDTDALLNQKNLQKIQNKKNILFCGSYFGYGFHEDGIKSSIEMLKTLND